MSSPARAKQFPDLALGRKWPHRILQWFPSSWKRDYLLRQSGGEEAAESFNLTDQLQGAKKFLIVWPEKAENALIAFAAVRALRAAMGEDAVRAHLVPSALSETIADLFPGEQILSWSREELAWHDSSVQASKASLRVFAPEVSINLMHPGASVISALVKASGAGLRMAFSDPDREAYANVRLQPGSESSWASAYFQFLNPWRYAGIAVEETWPSLESEAESPSVAEAWAVSGAAPERTWLYIHDASDSSRVLDDDFYSWLWEKIQMRDAEDVSIVLAVLNPPEGTLVREGRWRNVPVLKASGTAEFGGLVSLARGVAAFQGAGLHVAGLSDVRCLAFLRHDEAAYDVSGWNKLFGVEWIGP